MSFRSCDNLESWTTDFIFAIEGAKIKSTFSNVYNVTYMYNQKLPCDKIFSHFGPHIIIKIINTQKVFIMK